jgi:polysaccharide pyruvyl transferase WcaK-like protein
MRIALITYHYGYNEGTLLQAYATQQLLRNNLPGAEVEIVDWRSPVKEQLVFSDPKTGRERALRSFFETQIILTRESFRSQSPDFVFSYLRDHFDLVVVGSDELWRLEYNVTGSWPFYRYRQDNPVAPPFPNVYWPNACRLGVPCVSLASSISENDLISRIPRRHRLQIRDVLKNLSVLTVRDLRTERFVNDLLKKTKKQCQWLPDPTFSLPPSTLVARQAFGDRLRTAGINLKEPLALISSHTSSPTLQNLIYLCKQQGLQVVGITNSQPNVDVDLSQEDIGPFEWVAAPTFARVVITDRFHSAVFSIKSGVPVIAVDYRNQLSGVDSKMQDLFKRVGIEDYWLPVNNHTPLRNNDSLKSLFEENRWPAQTVETKAREFSEILKRFVSVDLRQVVSKANNNH